MTEQNAARADTVEPSRGCAPVWRGAARVFLTACLAVGLFAAPIHAPQLAHAEEAAPTAPASEPVETRVAVGFPLNADHTIYVLGRNAPVSAIVTALPAEGQSLPDALEGAVEFFDGDVSLGSAPLVPGAQADRATATLDTDRWPAAGARAITARFAPAAGSALEASTSTAQVYRIVDTRRMIADIELAGDAAAEVSDAELEWTIANIWFSNFNVGFHREVVDGPVTLPDMNPGTTIPELQAYYFRPFTFSRGSGRTDAAGNRVIGFTGTARLTSGSGNQWNFTDPEVRIAPNGDGYITAEFSGYYRIGVEQLYGPVRVTIATFSGAELRADGEGMVTATIDLNWDGQARGAGTWAHQHNSSFPNEFIALLNPGINLFFAQSSVATDSSKIPHPVTLSFRETEVPVTPEPPVVPVKPGAEPEAPTLTPENEVNEAGFTVVSVDGRVVTVNVGAQHANEWIGVFLHSDPQFLGWFLADALGNVTVTVPASVTGAHRLSFVNAAGALLGWVPVSYQSAGGTGGVPGATGAAGGLSTTGGQDLFAVGGVALLMLVSGGVLLAARRREKELMDPAERSASVRT